MKTVHKYALSMTDDQTIDIPVGAELLSATMQYSQPVAYAMVDTDAPTQKTLIHIRGTGHPLPPGPLKYLGTLQLASGRYMFHVFEGERR